MRIALAQINSVLGDFALNRQKILDQVKKAADRRCDLVITPEASLFGYHPVDLLERPSVVQAQVKELEKLHKSLPKDIAVLVGAIYPNPKSTGKPYLNAAVLLVKGQKPKVFAKQLLPTYDVFDEGRHIEPGETSKNVFKFKGRKILVTICEDIWAWAWEKAPAFARYPTNPLKKIKSAEVDLVVNLSASPFTDTKLANRRLVTRQTVKHLKAPMVYVNMVGAQDELIYDGGSFALNEKGQITAQCLRFAEDLNVIDLETGEGGKREIVEDLQETRRQALAMGIQDYMSKTGLKHAHLGLSGGIDSALVACLAVDALGPMAVTCIGLPGPYSSPNSLKWARQLADNLGCKWLEMPIESIYNSAVETLESSLGEISFGLVHENIQARARALLLMGYSNHTNSLLLTTSNKSEMAMGYSTLYGDMCGGLAPIADLLKGEVYDLSRHYNRERELIPPEIIERAPSAELRPNQTDQDTLPPYVELDKAVEKLVEGFRPPRGEVEKRVLRSMMFSEFKRWQAPPVLKVSDHAFGRGRRLPIAHRALF